MVREVLILGGGLAGASAALRLARAGIPVHLLERESGPHHNICGEFLSIEAQQDLARIGVCPVRLGAVPIDRVRVIRGRQRIEAALPFVAQGISRKRLDEALLEAAHRAGAEVQRGVRVIGLLDGEVQTSAGSLRARNLFVATGKHYVRGIRPSSSDARPSTGKDYVGFKMHWRIGPRVRAQLGGAIELVLFDGGYAGLQCVAGDILNLCLVVRRSRLAESGGHWAGLLAALLREPHIASRIGDAEPRFTRPLTIANLPYGFVFDPADTLSDAVFRLGDQAALTAPLTGDGMAIALRSSALAVAALQAGTGAAEYHRQIREHVRRQVWRAMFFQGMTRMPLASRLALGLLGLWPALLGKIAGVTRLDDWNPPAWENQQLSA